MKKVKKRPVRVELFGSTEFSVGSSTKPIAVDITIGYRQKTVNPKSANPVSVRYVYALLAAKDNKDITIKQLVEACNGSAADIPEALQNAIGFKSFSISYESRLDANKFEMALDTRIHLDKARAMDATITIGYERTATEKKFTFGGTLYLGGGHTFDIKFKKTPTASYLFASYRHDGVANIDLRKLSSAIFEGSVAESMPKVEFELEDFKAFILYRKQSDATGLLFGMGSDLNLDLEDLPMAGPIIAKEKSFSFEEVLVMYSKGAFTRKELEDFSGVPAIDVAAGFNISSNLKINGRESYYVLNGGADDDYSAEQPVKPAEVQPVSGETSSKANWTKIDKKLGPVTLQRLGFLYDKGKVVMLLDASMEAAGMGMQLIGLGLGFKLAWPPKSPEFYIDGLGLSYMKDPVRISGMFTRVAPKPAEVYSYYGAAQLSFSKFNISGIGAYSRLKATRQLPNGDVSLFIYALYQGAIGGPSFFFVTGIAAGFGYNRKVRIPAIQEVNTFPLVAMALNPVPSKSLNAILAELIAKDCIPTSPGDYWLAIGVKFTSFKIIESFLLAIVQFGTHTEFTILGLSILAWPDKQHPIAYVELALKANFGSNTDVVSVEAMLTSNSYVLDKNCKLTGGFAFYAWVSGPHEGDFVITLGGYHPRFVKPLHYPDVQRLGLNWRLSRELQIKGGLYYALTPSCIMAGGRLEITYTLSFLRGSIVVWADMLIAWAPFYYAIDIGICIRIEANIDMGLFYVRFNIEMGAQLHIYGPPFAGYVYVDWNIFAFTIPFGNAKVNKDYLDWGRFQKQFIPSKKEVVPADQGKDGNTPRDIYPAAEIMITAGIISETASYILVNPHKLIIKIDAPVPVITAKINNSDIPDDTRMPAGQDAVRYRNRNTALGIRPTNTRQLQSTLNVTVARIKGLVCSAYSGSVPEALWGPDEDKRSNSSPGATKVLPNVLKGLVLSPEERRVPAGTPQFDLNGKFAIVERQLDWKYIPALTGPDNAYYRDTRTVIEKILTDQRHSMNAIVMSAMRAQQMEDGILPGDNLAEWVSMMNAEPVIVQVGGLPQYKDR